MLCLRISSQKLEEISVIVKQLRSRTPVPQTGTLCPEVFFLSCVSGLRIIEIASELPFGREKLQAQPLLFKQNALHSRPLSRGSRARGKAGSGTGCWRDPKASGHREPWRPGPRLTASRSVCFPVLAGFTEPDTSDSLGGANCRKGNLPGSERRRASGARLRPLVAALECGWSRLTEFRGIPSETVSCQETRQLGCGSAGRTGPLGAGGCAPCGSGFSSVTVSAGAALARAAERDAWKELGSATPS